MTSPLPIGAGDRAGAQLSLIHVNQESRPEPRRPEELAALLDGLEFAVDHQPWRIEVFSASETNGCLYLQGAANSSKTARMFMLRVLPDSAARHIVPSLRRWLALGETEDSVVDVEPPRSFLKLISGGRKSS